MTEVVAGRSGDRSLPEPLAKPFQSPDQQPWLDLVEGIRNMYPKPLADEEAEAAARNLVTFYQTLLAIKKRAGQDDAHEQRH